LIEPLICEFHTTNGNLYVYDTFTNYTYPVDDIDLFIIKNYKKLSLNEIKNILASKYLEDDIAKSYCKVKQWVKHDKAFFPAWSSGLFNNLNLPTQTEFNRLLSNIKMLTLEITQKCNLRCKYCVFSGNFKYWRQHTNLNMNWKIAKQSIDYFLKLIHSYTRLTTFKGGLTFFGGEPLLNFPLIEKCALYFKAQLKNEEPIFGITTNGTLLNRQIIKFLVKNNFQLTISLDGPPSEHDKKRVFSNGKGSFGRVIKNLDLLYKFDKNYCEKNISFNIVYTPSTNLKKVVLFFSDLMNKYNFTPIINFAFVNTYNIKENIFDNNNQESKNILIDLKTQYFDFKKADKKMNSYYYCLDKLFGGDHPSFYYRSCMNDKEDLGRFLGGQCYPGCTKIYVQSDGSFLICEKVNGKFVIGNCEQGVIYEKVIEILTKFSRKILNECDKCFCNRVCLVCAASVATDNDFDKNGICDIVRENFKKFLIDHYSIMEKNPNAWKREMLGNNHF